MMLILFYGNAQQAMNSWRDMICRIIHKGIEKGEIRPDVDADEVVTIPISTLEGAVMMSAITEIRST